MQRLALSEQDNRIINRIVARFKQQSHHIRFFKRKVEIRHIEYDTRVLAGDIKTMLLKPALLTVSEIGNVLSVMTNSERLLLLVNRAYVFEDCYDLMTILKYHLPVEDRTLFACAFVEIMYRENDEMMHTNIKRVAETLPLHEQTAYIRFCLKVMEHIRSKQLASQVSYFKKAFTGALLFAQTITKFDSDLEDPDDRPPCIVS